MSGTSSLVSSAVIQPGTTFIVSGRVFSSQRSGVGGLGIEVVDKNVGADAPLAKGAADASGNYSVQFSSAEFTGRGKTAPDIQVRVLSGQTLLVASEVRYNASANEKIDVVLPATAAASLPSEHETLTTALSFHFKGNLRDLKETDQQQDITFLANKTGWDARAVALAALADQFSQASRPVQPPVPATRVGAAVAIPAVPIRPEFYYALFRAGLPANPDTLYQADQQTVVNTWKQSIAQGVIPKALENQIPQAQQAFQTLSAQKLLTGQTPVGVSPLKDMLAVSRLTDAQQQNFASLYAANRTDLNAFWKSVSNSFGPDVANRIQLNGKLAFLTINNVSLMQQLHQQVGGNAGISDPAQLAQAGFHRAAKWEQILSANVPIPAEIPGSASTKKANYAAYLAAHVRLSYPTASIAEMVRAGDFKVNASEQVSKFLNDHQGKFEISMQPVQQYIAKNKLKVDAGVVEEVKKLQRVNQMTQSDQAMQALLKNNAHSAYQIVRMDKQAFVQKMSADMGGADEAVRVYHKAVQTHHAVMNIAVSYITARSGFQLGADPLPDGQPKLVLNAAPAKPGRKGNNGQVLQPAPSGPTPQNADDVIAYPTLEKLFGSMDFCTCSDCRSVLSPAAYLVDLLDFIDQEPSAADKAAGKLNPQGILLGRRPDLQHLPLTCENTNTALPYIDVVNETLEYYVANQVQALSLQGYKGHDTGDAASADLLASPQFVMDAAYTLLRGERFPSQLPFHQPLENLRRYFEKFEVPLPLAMERLRKTDDLERGGSPYGWRDILAEELRLSRDEYDLLTNGALTLKQIYGFAPAKTDAQVADELSNAKKFSRRAEISYLDVVSLLNARFINPNSDLIPKLSKLGVNIAMLVELKTKNDAATDKKFDDLLPQGAAAPGPAEYGGDIKKWVKDPANFDRIMGLITLTDPTSSPGPCNFGNLEFRFAKPMADANDKSTRLGTPEFVRMLRFIRLWKKTGWSIEQTDAAIGSLYRADLKPVTAGDLDSVAKLDTGFKALLPRLGIISRVMRLLNLSVGRDFLPLLACWSDISTRGDNSLYRQMFLNPAVAQRDPDFADNGFGEFLVNNKKLLEHTETLRAAFNLTGDEFDRIVAAVGFDANTLLTLPNISALYRRGWLAHKMRLSVRELLLLISLTGLDPFAAPDSPSAGDPAIVHLITLVQAMKARSLKSAAALYLIWNQDLSGKSAPTPAQVTEFARTLRGDFAAIEDQFAATEDPGGDVARARMTLVYGEEASDAFFALLNNTIVLDVSYTHPAPALGPAITAVDANLSYDSFRHRLSHTGLLSAVTQGNLKAVVGVTQAFKDAIDKLFGLSQDASGSFFARYPELKPLYDSYIASAGPIEVKRSKLLAAFRPALSRLRKQQQALQRLSTAAVVDLPATQALVNAPAAPFSLHAAGDKTQPALNDVLAVETPGLAVQFFFRDTATGAVDKSSPADANLDYAPVTNPLPANPAPGAAISGIWTGSVEAPDSGFYNIIIETDAGASVGLTLDGKVRPLVQNGTLWRNNDSIELSGGKLYDIVLKVEKVKQNLSVKWENPKRSREVVPGRYLYPPTIVAPFRDVYIRFLKATSLATTLQISADELVRFANDPDYQVNADGWLNSLPVSGSPALATAAALLRPLEALLSFAEIKAAVSPTDNQLLTALLGPASATANPDSLMFSLLRWDKVSLTALLQFFGAVTGDLAHFDIFRKIYNAFALVQTMGISATALVKATTNGPDGNTVRDFQSALRARYDAASWRDIIQPINNDMRDLQRDALVAYVLHQFREDPTTEQIDTPDKLFEYFLMDVEMEPCMQTSRIRHALSTVQLFIERCLMNLEPHATLSTTQAKRWEWMKRYRVWEANRKVFLYPENWLEPELRDDKSPFFKEIESELLQGDITDDRAAIALLNYLAKLEEVAKLEICGIHYIPADPASLTDEVAHVVARTSGAHRKYYYRRLEFGYWTAWEQIKLDIEDNPVVPVIWNDRLFTFWLRVMKKGPSTAQGQKPGGSDLQSLTLPPDPSITIQAALCWSEYYNGKWQLARTSDVDNPINIGTFAPGAFDRMQLKLSALFWTEGSLRMIVSYGSGSGVSFFLHNAFSNPELRSGKKEPHFSPPRALETSTPAPNPAPTLKITYSGSSLSSHVVNDSIADRGIQPNHPVAGNPWDPPFFFEDARHVFYVTTSEQLVLLPIWNDIGAFLPPVKVRQDIPSLVLQPVTIIPDPIGPIARLSGFGVNDPSPAQRYITQDAYIHQAIGTLGTVRYGDTEIGVAGSQIKSVRNR